MADRYGALAIPAIADESPVGDPALGFIGGFIQAVVNSDYAQAWGSLRPRGGPEAQPIRTVFFHEPEKAGFNENLLPALFLWREQGKHQRLGDDWRESAPKLKALWVFPPATQEHQRTRLPSAHAVAAIIDHWFEFGRHPAWVASGDTDITAASVPADADSILLAKATQTSAVSYAGVQLDGIVGQDTMSPRREIVITTAVATGAYNTSQPIEVVGIDWYGLARTWTATLTQANGGEQIGIGEDIASVASVAFPAMLSTAGSISVGTAKVEGRGSVLATVARLAQPAEVTDWRYQPIKIEVLDDEGRVSTRLEYHAVAMTLEIHERFVADVSDGSYAPNAHASNGITVEGFVASSAVFPDNGTT